MSATPSIVIAVRSTYAFRDDYGHHTLTVSHENGTTARISIIGEPLRALRRLADAADLATLTLTEETAMDAEEVEP